MAVDRIFGLIGYPLGHSFSANYFTQKFARENIAAEYRNFQMESIKDLEQVLEQIPNLGGFNVTIPHKQNVLPYLHELDREAAEIGAVNVIKATKTAGGYLLKGFNSDVIGFEQSLVPQLKSTHKKALVFGTGGASKAVVYALKKLGIAYRYVSRSPQNGHFSYAQITPKVMAEYTLLVNCTPLGMSPQTHLCPDIPYDALTQAHYLYDLIYNPEVPLFLQKGLEKGAAIKNGLEMLHLQADASWEIWNR